LLFCTSQFCLFFLVVFAAYWALPWQRGRVLLLLAASIYFYACWNHWLALLLCVSTLGDYLIARGMEATDRPRVRKLLLFGSLIANLGLLSWFKYVNFFLGSLEEATGLLGLSVSMPVLEVIVPVGISFYTFEAINYTVDVYRGKCRAAHDLTHFMLFVLFFPHLVEGKAGKSLARTFDGVAPNSVRFRKSDCNNGLWRKVKGWAAV
jgi:alginate O-acetyltransferase complex protein AlgI